MNPLSAAELLERHRKLVDSLKNLEEESDEHEEPSTKRPRMAGDEEEFESPTSPPSEEIYDRPDPGYDVIVEIEKDNDDRNAPLICPSRPVVGPRTPSASPPSTAPPSLPPMSQTWVGPPTSPTARCPMASNGFSPNMTRMGNGGDSASDGDSRTSASFNAMTESGNLEPTTVTTVEADNDVDMDDLDVDESSQSRDDGVGEPPVKIEKTVLESFETAHFDPLPENWLRTTHASGMHVYMHRPTRVITWSRPYMIGKTDSLRHHELPLSAIPCLHQKKINERKAEAAAQVEELKRKQLDQQGQTGDQHGSDLPIAAPEVTVERSEDNVLKAEELTAYAKLRFDFKTILVNKCANFKDKKRNRQEARMQQENAAAIEAANAVSTSTGSKGLSVITIPTPDGRFNKREFVLNPAGKTSLSILHDYTQQVLKGRIIYDFDDTRNTQIPFHVTAIIMVKKSIREKLDPAIREKLAMFQEMMKMSRPLDRKEAPRPDEEPIVVARAEANSKKAGKMVASRIALKTFIPNLQFDDEHYASIVGNENKDNYDDQTVELFEKMPVEDIRVVDLCCKTGTPKPFALLTEACNRIMELDGAQPQMSTRTVAEPKQHTEVTLSVGEWTATVIAKGTKEAKQRAAQALLQKMNPTVTNFGTIIRMYSGESKELKEAKKHHDEVVRLQNRGSRLEPNMAVITKLKEEMARIAQQLTPDMSVRPPIPTSYPPVTV